LASCPADARPTAARALRTAAFAPPPLPSLLCLFFFNDPPTAAISPLSLHDALPIFADPKPFVLAGGPSDPQVLLRAMRAGVHRRSEEHTSELQSLTNLVCRLLLEKKKFCGASRLLSAVSTI